MLTTLYAYVNMTYVMLKIFLGVRRPLFWLFIKYLGVMIYNLKIFKTEHPPTRFVYRQNIDHCILPLVVHLYLPIYYKIKIIKIIEPINALNRHFI